MSSIPQESSGQKSEGPDEPIAIIDAVTFEGATTLTDDVKARITTALSGETRHSDWLQRFEAKAKKEFHNDGFLDAALTTKVNSSRQVDGVEHVTMLVTPTEGPRYRIQSINLVGLSPISDAELRRFGTVHPGDFFNGIAIQNTMAAIRSELAERGFKESSVVPSWRLSRDKATVAVYLDIATGEKDTNIQPATCNPPSATDVRIAPFVPSTGYDPQRNGELDIARAELEAERRHKKVLILIGGDWCPPCVALERKLMKDSSLSAILKDSFVVVYLNVSEGNRNECAFRKLPNAF
jgi:hypothetical protein